MYSVTQQELSLRIVICSFPFLSVMRTNLRLGFWVRIGSSEWLLLLNDVFLSSSSLRSSSLDDLFQAFVKICISTVHGVSSLGRLLQEMGRRVRAGCA